MIVYGKNVCLEYIKNHEVLRVYVEKNFKDNDILKYVSVPIKVVDENYLNNLCHGLHQGIAVEIEDFKYSDISSVLNKEDSILVMLDHLEDPHNFGAIVRTCEAAGVDGIIIPENRSVSVNATVIKTSAGTVRKVPIFKVTNLVNTLSLLKKNNYWVIGTNMSGEDFRSIDYKGKIVIVIGNEGKGMSKLVEENCDFIASIPMRGSVNSLNASVASALVIYEALRNRC